MKIIVVKRSHSAFFSSFPLIGFRNRSLHLPYWKKFSQFLEIVIGIFAKFIKIDVLNLMPQYGYYPKGCKISTVYWDATTKKYPSIDTIHLDLFIESCLRRSDKIIIWFDSNLNDFNVYYPGLNAKVERINFGVDLQVNYGKPSKKVHSEDFYDLMYVATSQPRKRLREFLEICSELIKRGHASSFCLVTTYDGQVYAEKYFSILKGKITIECEIDSARMSELYLRSKYFLNTSVYEGLGLPNVESIYHGTPVICSDISIYRELLGNSGIYISAELGMTEKNYSLVREMLSLSNEDRMNIWLAQSNSIHKLLDFSSCHKRLSIC